MALAPAYPGIDYGLVESGARRTLARAIVLSLIGLSYLAAMEAWPRFLEGFADSLCADRFCSDALFRSYAIPIATAALVASAFACWLAVEGPDSPPAVLGAIGGLAAVFAIFLVSATSQAWHFLVGGLAACVAAGSIWRASGGAWLGTVLVALAAPWPFLAFGLGYPAPR